MKIITVVIKHTIIRRYCCTGVKSDYAAETGRENRNRKTGTKISKEILELYTITTNEFTFRLSRNEKLYIKRENIATTMKKNAFYGRFRTARKTGPTGK